MTTCANCSSTDLMSLSLTLKGGPVSFTHCRACEHRSWSDAEHGGQLPLPEVLTKVVS